MEEVPVVDTRVLVGTYGILVEQVYVAQLRTTSSTFGSTIGLQTLLSRFNSITMNVRHDETWWCTRRRFFASAL